MSCDRCLDGRARVDRTRCSLQTGEFTRPIFEVLVQEIGNLRRLLLELFGVLTLSPLTILLGKGTTHLLNRTTHPAKKRHNQRIRSIQPIGPRVVEGRDRSLVILESRDVHFAEQAFGVRLACLVPQRRLLPDASRKDVDAVVLRIERLRRYPNR